MYDINCGVAETGPPGCINPGEVRTRCEEFTNQELGQLGGDAYDVNIAGIIDKTVDVGTWSPQVFRSSNGTEIIVTHDCLMGICSCCYLLGGKATQLHQYRSVAFQ